MVKISIFGGKNEIGGNKILVEHEGTRIFLDFGMSFNQNSYFFSEYLNPRKCAALRDFFEFGLLPEMKGIYRTDYLEHMKLPSEERSVDAVFLSHAHADHVQYVHFLRWDIPIYCTEATKIIMDCVQKTGSGSFSDLVNACESFKFYENSKGGQSRVDRRIAKNKTEYLHDRVFEIMKLNTRIKVGSFEVEMIPVDHSLPGACGFIIYTNEGNIVYTGDIRFHGSNGRLSREFVKKAKDASPKWLICEGTRIDSNNIDSEKDVQQQIGSIISEAKGLVFVEHPIRDIDRVNSLFKASKANERTFAVPPKLAHLIEALEKDCPFTLDDVEILVPPKGWGLITKEDINPELITKDYKWENEIISKHDYITFKDLIKSPEKYVVSMSMWEVGQLVDIQPENAIWIKSSCEPFSDEMLLDDDRKKHWLEHFEIKEFSAHASGHASGNEIRDMIKEIGAETVIPVHTENPDMFEVEE